MCSACGYPVRPGHWTEAGEANIGDRLRARIRRVQVLKRVLSPYGIEALDDGFMPGFQLSTSVGDHTVAMDLTEVWITAEKLTGKAVDPLSSHFVG